MPLKDSVGPNSLPSAGVVVNDVQKDFQAGIVESRQHFLKLAQALFRL
jgi:hypothetical protein